MRKKKLKKISESFWDNYFETNKPIVEAFFKKYPSTKEDTDE